MGIFPQNTEVNEIAVLCVHISVVKSAVGVSHLLKRVCQRICRSIPADVHKVDSVLCHVFKLPVSRFAQALVVVAKIGFNLRERAWLLPALRSVLASPEPAHVDTNVVVGGFSHLRPRGIISVIVEVIQNDVVKPHFCSLVGCKFDLHTIKGFCGEVNGCSYLAVYVYFCNTGFGISVNVQILPYVCNIVVKDYVTHHEFSVNCFEFEDFISCGHERYRRTVNLFGKKNEGLECYFAIDRIKASRGNRCLSLGYFRDHAVSVVVVTASVPCKREASLNVPECRSSVGSIAQGKESLWENVILIEIRVIELNTTASYFFESVDNTSERSVLGDCNLAYVFVVNNCKGGVFVKVDLKGYNKAFPGLSRRGNRSVRFDRLRFTCKRPISVLLGKLYDLVALGVFKGNISGTVCRIDDNDCLKS